MATDTAPQNVAQTVEDISKRVSLLVREEIELAKAEVTAKVTKLLRGIVIGVAAGIFAVTGLMFFLHGLAWLAWYALPVGNSLNYFWGFFFMAGLLFVLGGIAGFLAAKFLKESSPPTPDMAIDEAGKIRKTLMFRRKKKS